MRAMSLLKSTVLLGLVLISAGAIAGGHAAKAKDHAGMDHGAMDHGAMDHSGHDMAGHSTEKDELGRRLYGMQHKMDPEMTAELREKVDLFEKYSDAEIALSMNMMGGNYAWYLSDDSVAGSQGVLLLLHGFKNEDGRFKRQIESMTNIFPTAMAPGMSMMMSDHIQLALDDIKAAGAQQIVVVPIVSNAYNTMLRQWEYIFGMRDEAAYASVSRVNTDAQVLFAKPPGDDPLIAEILLDHAYELSEDAPNEAVVIAAHGPQSAEDNVKALAELEILAKYMREDGDFASVQGITLQDDAPAEVRDANVEKLRGIVAGAQSKGQRVLVVTNLIGSRTIQAKLRADLKGLDYTFNAKGIVEHPNFMKWMGETIREQFERNTLASR